MFTLVYIVCDFTYFMFVFRNIHAFQYEIDNNLLSLCRRFLFFLSWCVFFLLRPVSDSFCLSVLVGFVHHRRFVCLGLLFFFSFFLFGGTIFFIMVRFQNGSYKSLMPSNRKEKCIIYFRCINPLVI